MNACQISIRGMHCRSCEILIEDELKKIPGVTKAVVSHRTGAAEIYFDRDLDTDAVKNAVEAAGYSLGTDEHPLLSKNRQDYLDLGRAFFIAFGLFFAARALGIFNLGSSVTGSYTSLPAVFLIGLTAGVSTCMALVGGLVLGSASRYAAKHPLASGLEKFKPHLWFNLGRIISYIILGGLLGFAGSVFHLSPVVLGLMTVAVGLVMLILGGQLIDIFPFLKKISFTLPKGLSHLLGIKGQSEKEYSHQNSAVMGALTFFLPCGFTQAMQLYAMSTGDPLKGALTMGVFALGTAPGLLSVGGLTSVIKGKAARLFFKTAGVVVVLLAFFNLSNGLNLLGLNSDSLKSFAGVALAENSNEATAANNTQVQEITMTQTSSGYTPNKFTIKKGVPVSWVITSKNPNSCAASIVSQKLGIHQNLVAGKNVIEFTPKEVGTIRFSCAMGMFSGSFTVVETNSNTVSQTSASTESEEGIVRRSLGEGGSCGQGGCGCGGGTAAANQEAKTGTVANVGNVQVLTATYSATDDIKPNRFTVKVNQPVKLEIVAKNDGEGCMGTVTLPGLTKKIVPFTRGETATFEFTPTKTGSFDITCAMGMPRGKIIVN